MAKTKRDDEALPAEESTQATVPQEEEALAKGLEDTSWDARHSEEKYLQQLCRMLLEKEKLTTKEKSELMKGKTAASRLEYLLSWYNKKADENKEKYNKCRDRLSCLPLVITVMSAASILFTSINPLSKLAPAFAGISSFAAALISAWISWLNSRMEQYRYYENWMRYRGTAERLKSSIVLYMQSVPPYTRKDENGNYPELSPIEQLALDIEKTAMDELSQWENLQAEAKKNISPAEPKTPTA